MDPRWIRNRRQLRATGNWFYFLGNVPKKFLNFCSPFTEKNGIISATENGNHSYLIPNTGLYWDIIDIIHRISIAIHRCPGCPWMSMSKDHTSAALPFRPPASYRPKRASELAADGPRNSMVCVFNNKKWGDMGRFRNQNWGNWLQIAHQTACCCCIIQDPSNSLAIRWIWVDLSVRGIGVQSAAPAVNHVWSIILTYFAPRA